MSEGFTEDAAIEHQLILSAAVIAATTFLHGLFVAAAAAVFRASASRTRGLVRFMRDTVALVLMVLWLMFAHFLEIGVWAFHHYGMFDQWETALYFAGASFTTLGFGDVLLPEEWRLLSGAAAANGLLLFGLSAAFLFEAVRRLHLGGAREG